MSRVLPCVSQVLGKGRFPAINEVLTRPSPSYVAVREMQKVREEREKGKGEEREKGREREGGKSYNL